MTNHYALIVGIEKYAMSGWNRSGPVAGALDMACWCTGIGMQSRNIHLFVSINDLDQPWADKHEKSIAVLRKTGVTIHQDTTLNTIDTFWRQTLPRLASSDSKLLVYWCGHGITSADRDRVLIHTDYDNNKLTARVTSSNNLLATLASQPYRCFREQLVLADVCADFTDIKTSPNRPQPPIPDVGIVQHSYFASVDGKSTTIANGIGAFTTETLDVLSKYITWPSLDDFRDKMNGQFGKENPRSFKLLIRTPQEELDEASEKSELIKGEPQPSVSRNTKSSSLEILIQTKKKCEQLFILDYWEDLLKEIENFVSILKKEQHAIKRIIFRKEYNGIRDRKIKNTISPEDFARAKNALWENVSDFFDSIRDEIEAESSGDSIAATSGDASDDRDFFRGRVESVLMASRGLSDLLNAELDKSDKEGRLNALLDYLFLRDRQPTADFPLRQLKWMLLKLMKKKSRPEKVLYSPLLQTRELLSIASYPLRDRGRIEVAMLQILESKEFKGNAIDLGTSKIADAEKLLIATRLKLSGEEFRDLDITQLLNNRPESSSSPEFLLDYIRIVREPTLQSDNRTVVEWYAECCIRALDFDVSTDCWEVEFKKIVGQLKKAGVVVCLLLSKEKSEAIEIMKNAIPDLMVVPLPATSIDVYNEVLFDLTETERYLRTLFPG